MYKNLFFLSFIFSFHCLSIELPENFIVSFDSGMNITSLYESNKAMRYKEWVKAHILYNNYVQNILENINNLDSLRIPKKIHQIWIGPHPLPTSCKKFQQTWLELHPDWEYKLWTDKDIEEFELTNKKLYDQSTNWGQKADIARYEILYRLGGLYIDTDFECIRSFDIFHYSCDFYAGIVNNCPSKFLIANGLIGSAPGHQLLKEVIKNMTLEKTEEQGERNRIMETTGPYYFTRHILRFLEEDHFDNQCVLFPMSYFYPWPSYERHNNNGKQILKWIKPETSAIHHWHCSWMK